MKERLIILFRHGIAEERRDSLPDEKRRLTRTGHQRMKEISRGLTRILEEVDALYSSPLVRAIETAEWIEKAYERRVRIARTEHLAPGADRDAALQFVQQQDGERLIFVGHEPNLTALMLGLTKMDRAGELELKKGGCYGVVAGEGASRLEWMLPPRVLRRG